MRKIFNWKPCAKLLEQLDTLVCFNHSESPHVLIHRDELRALIDGFRDTSWKVERVRHIAYEAEYPDHDVFIRLMHIVDDYEEPIPF